MTERPRGDERLPPGEHGSELPDGQQQAEPDRETQEENAGTSLDQPSQ